MFQPASGPNQDSHPGCFWPEDDRSKENHDDDWMDYMTSWGVKQNNILRKGKLIQNFNPSYTTMEHNFHEL